jgi:hypothetical protein
MEERRMNLLRDIASALILAILAYVCFLGLFGVA